MKVRGAAGTRHPSTDITGLSPALSVQRCGDERQGTLQGMGGSRGERCWQASGPLFLQRGLLSLRRSSTAERREVHGITGDSNIRTLETVTICTFSLLSFATNAFLCEKKVFLATACSMTSHPAS